MNCAGMRRAVVGRFVGNSQNTCIIQPSGPRILGGGISTKFLFVHGGQMINLIAGDVSIGLDTLSPPGDRGAWTEFITG
jgi:hypothetical protein